MNTRKMTKAEAREYLNNKKVYVNGKSAEIQKKLFEVGFKWKSDDTKVKVIDAPFLFIRTSISYDCNMSTFKNSELKEITADDILSIEIASAYKPFECLQECLHEMYKHEHFSWVLNRSKSAVFHINEIHYNGVYFTTSQNKDNLLTFEYMLNNFVFLDNTPFGIKVK